MKGSVAKEKSSWNPEGKIMASMEMDKVWEQGTPKILWGEVTW